MNIAMLLRRAAADHAGQVALRLDDTEVRYGEFAERAARFAAYLRASGVAGCQQASIACRPTAVMWSPATSKRQGP